MDLTLTRQPPTEPLERRTSHTRYRVITGLIVLGFGCWVLIQIHFSNLAYYIVTSESMEPTIRIGDHLIMVRPKEFRPGEVVVLDRPDHPGEQLVKRIVALGPAHVEVRRGQLFADGRRSDPPIGKTPPSPIPHRNWNLKPGEVFVAGDNRPNSEDSRDFGPVPLEMLRGVVRYRIDSLLHWVPIE